MKRLYFLLLPFFFAIVVLLPADVSAHQPRLVSDQPLIVTEPEISKAYYGQLAGTPHIYRISAAAPFQLYVSVVVPDIAGQKKDVSAVIIKDGLENAPLAVLNGSEFSWQRFYEKFGADWYWQGPEYKGEAAAGEYEIRVWSSNNDSKYSLAVGEIEAFDIKESLNALTLVPQLKRDFFNESPISFIKSPFGWGLLLGMFILAFLAGLAYRTLLKRFASGPARRVGHNIARSGRLMRAALGLGLLFLAVTTNWNPFLLFASGFCFFEAMFSWCGLNAALGRNECPL